MLSRQLRFYIQINNMQFILLLIACMLEFFHVIRVVRYDSQFKT